MTCKSNTVEHKVYIHQEARQELFWSSNLNFKIAQCIKTEREPIARHKTNFLKRTGRWTDLQGDLLYQRIVSFADAFELVDVGSGHFGENRNVIASDHHESRQGDQGQIGWEDERNGWLEGIWKD